MSSTNSDSFTYYFSIWTLLISFSSLIAVIRTSKTILKRNCENGHHCLAPDLIGNSFTFTQLKMMLFLIIMTILAEAWVRGDPRVPQGQKRGRVPTLEGASRRLFPRVPRGPARGKSVYEVVINSEKIAIHLI